VNGVRKLKLLNHNKKEGRMKRLAKVLGVLAVVLALISPAMALDKIANTDALPGLSTFDTSVIEVWCVGKGLGMYPEASRNPETGTFTIIPRYMYGEFGQMGTGWVIQNGNFIITAAHVVTPTAVMMKISENEEYVGPLVYATEVNFYVGKYNDDKAKRKLVKAKVFYINQETDVAILVVDGQLPNFLSSMHIELRATTQVVYTMFGAYYDDEMDYGNQVAVIVRQRDETGGMKDTYEVRVGRIISGAVALPDTVTKDAIAWFTMNDVTMDVPVIPGDSGSAVIGWVDGVPYIIGVARAACTNGETTYSYFSRIDVIKIITEATFAEKTSTEAPKSTLPDSGKIRETTPQKGGPYRPIKYEWKVLAE
jgi:S1-C subfamily serine protease